MNKEDVLNLLYYIIGAGLLASWVYLFMIMGVLAFAELSVLLPERDLNMFGMVVLSVGFIPFVLRFVIIVVVKNMKKKGVI